MNAAPEVAWIRPLGTENLKPVAHLRGRFGRAVQPAAENLGMIVGLAEMEPGQDTGWDVHPEPEAFYVLSGSGEGRWESEGTEHAAPLVPGAVFYKIGGIRHRMVNTGPAPLLGVFFKIKPASGS